MVIATEPVCGSGQQQSITAKRDRIPTTNMPKQRMITALALTLLAATLSDAAPTSKAGKRANRGTTQTNTELMTTTAAQMETETFTYPTSDLDILTTDSTMYSSFTDAPADPTITTEEPLPDSVLRQLEREKAHEKHLNQTEHIIDEGPPAVYLVKQVETEHKPKPLPKQLSHMGMSWSEPEFTTMPQHAAIKAAATTTDPTTKAGRRAPKTNKRQKTTTPQPIDPRKVAIDKVAREMFLKKPNQFESNENDYDLDMSEDRFILQTEFVEHTTQAPLLDMNDIYPTTHMSALYEEDNEENSEQLAQATTMVHGFTQADGSILGDASYRTETTTIALTTTESWMSSARASASTTAFTAEPGEDDTSTAEVREQGEEVYAMTEPVLNTETPEQIVKINTTVPVLAEEVVTTPVSSENPIIAESTQPSTTTGFTMRTTTTTVPMLTESLDDEVTTTSNPPITTTLPILATELPHQKSLAHLLNEHEMQASAQLKKYAPIPNEETTLPPTTNMELGPETTTEPELFITSTMPEEIYTPTTKLNISRTNSKLLQHATAHLADEMSPSESRESDQRMVPLTTEASFIITTDSQETSTEITTSRAEAKATESSSQNAEPVQLLVVSVSNEESIGDGNSHVKLLEANLIEEPKFDDSNELATTTNLPERATTILAHTTTSLPEKITTMLSVVQTTLPPQPEVTTLPVDRSKGAEDVANDDGDNVTLSKVTINQLQAEASTTTTTEATTTTTEATTTTTEATTTTTEATTTTTEPTTTTTEATTTSTTEKATTTSETTSTTAPTTTTTTAVPFTTPTPTTTTTVPTPLALLTTTSGSPNLLETTTTTTPAPPTTTTVKSSSSEEQTTLSSAVVGPEARALHKPAPHIERIFNEDGVEVLHGYSSVVRSNRT
ncbi:mucin-5AC [Scaptodrosophila lebanonensis]|uniref:Mucin-5AC n=1 Tax=Drosophila lebanonensis TaxID=7225 RepID=A0A6J2U6U6_DROLE|nr:mucin-5AC [Scaptodrosophila lebanonensis]